jgi:hypothetical protein
MDYFQRILIYKREIELRKKKRILNQLDIAEAFNFAYMGSQPGQKGKTNKGFKMYGNWRRQKYRELNPDLYKTTVWDNSKKSRRIN